MWLFSRIAMQKDHRTSNRAGYEVMHSQAVHLRKPAFDPALRQGGHWSDSRDDADDSGKHYEKLPHGTPRSMVRSY
jgi:hypothetical protein